MRGVERHSTCQLGWIRSLLLSSIHLLYVKVLSALHSHQLSVAHGIRLRSAICVMTSLIRRLGADFTEGQLINYKHFDAYNIEPLLEFGFGLSYTEFELGQNLDVHIQPGLQAFPDHSLGKIPGCWKDLWNAVATVSVEVKNVGKAAGSVVPQLYVAFLQDTTSSGTPLRVLRGFSKKSLEPGTAETVFFSLDRKDVSFWDVTLQKWIIPQGDFTFSVGFSSRDLRLEESSCVLELR
jgi:beta-glucosidase